MQTQTQRRLLPLLMALIFAITSCTKEVSNDNEILMEFGGAQTTQLNTGKRTWVVAIALNKPSPLPVRVVFSFDDTNGNKGMTISTPIQFKEQRIEIDTYYPVSHIQASAHNFQVLAVYGTENTKFVYKQR